MSSIYDALQRIQAGGGTTSSGESAGKSLYRGQTLYFVIAAIIISSAFTAALFYGVNVMKDGKGQSDTVSLQDGSFDPEQAVAVMNKAESQYELGDVSEAIKTYSDALRLAPQNLDGYLRLGGIYYELEEYDKALLTYTKAMRYYKNDARLLNNVGSVLLARQEMDKAITYFIHSNRVSDDFVEPVYNLACAYAKLGDNARALQAFKKAFRLNPDVGSWALDDPDLEHLIKHKDFNAVIHAQ